MGSKTIKTMLSGMATRFRATRALSLLLYFAGRFQESSGVVRFPELTSQVLERVIQYLHHRRKYLESPVPVPEFDISNEEALELIMAANFLDC